MRRTVAALLLLMAWCGAAWGQDTAKQDHLFLPRHWIRGYLDFDVAPQHHEIDLGLCTPPGCSAFARYAWSAYVDVQSISGCLLKPVFVFAAPKLYGGNNEPQVNYTASAALIAWEREAGVGWQLPHGVQLRLTQHQTFLLGRFAKAGVPVNPNGPYGANVRVGVRWNFGGYGSSER